MFTLYYIHKILMQRNDDNIINIIVSSFSGFFRSGRYQVFLFMLSVFRFVLLTFQLSRWELIINKYLSLQISTYLIYNWMGNYYKNMHAALFIYGLQLTK